VHLPRGRAGRRARKLRQAITEHVIENDARALGISPGTDLGTVLINCREAERRLLVRDVALAALTVALIVLAAVLQPTGLVVVVVWILAAEVIYAEAVLATWGVVARRFFGVASIPSRSVRAARVRASCSLRSARRRRATSPSTAGSRRSSARVSIMAAGRLR
jgi:hypothetical protein